MVVGRPFSLFPSVHFLCSLKLYVYIWTSSSYSLSVHLCQAGCSLTGSLYTSLVSIEMAAFYIGSLSVQSLVNRILCLVPLDPCAMPQFHVVRTSGMSQTRLHSASGTNAEASYFKLNQVTYSIETWVTSSIPISLSPSSRDTEPPVPTIVLAMGIEPRMLTVCIQYVKLWHYTGSNPPMH